MVNEQKFIRTNHYGGVELNEFRNEYKLISVDEAKNGGLFQCWGYPQRNKQPIDRAVPMGVNLGKLQTAIATLETVLAMLKAGASTKDVKNEFPGSRETQP